MSNKSQKKRTAHLYLYLALLIIGVIAIMIFGVAAIHTLSNQSKRDQDSNNNQTEDGANPDTETNYSVLQSLDSQGVLDFIASGSTGFLYVGRPTCPHCQKFAPILTDIVSEDDLTVFYYDTDAANSDPDKKSEALSVLGVTGVPKFFRVVDGIIVATFSGAHEKSTLLDFIEQYK